jgi:hypothetical protein
MVDSIVAFEKRSVGVVAQVLYLVIEMGTQVESIVKSLRHLSFLKKYHIGLSPVVRAILVEHVVSHFDEEGSAVVVEGSEVGSDLESEESPQTPIVEIMD